MYSVLTMTHMTYKKNKFQIPLDCSNPVVHCSVYRLVSIKSCRIYFQEICFKVNYKKIHSVIWRGSTDQDGGWTGKES